jgi:transcriptional regulator with XRE-family HTH domain
MPQLAAPFRERNRALGRLLLSARTSQSIPLSTCAELIGTSRRRYAAMEQGEAMIGFAEFEVLVEFLHIPHEAIGGPFFSHRPTIVVRQPGERATPGQQREVHLPMSPGETLSIVIVVDPS